MIVHLRRRPIVFLTISIVITISFVFYFSSYNKNHLKSVTSTSDISAEKCIEGIHVFSLENLPVYINKFESSKNPGCNAIAQIFNNMFKIEPLYGELKIPTEYEKKINQWLNNDAELFSQIKNQKIIKLYNKYMHEEMIYNPLRGKRPQPKESETAKNYTYGLLKESMKDCDFCDERYKSNTAYDTFGRMETKYSYTAANTFKYDKWHSLIVSRNHDTLNLNEIETIDMFDLALKWFDKVNKIDNNAKYPEILWDAMPKSGASQIHTHLQASMGINSYYGGMQRLQSASKLYYNEFNRDYIDDFILVHQALGLSLLINKTYVILNLIPVKEHEVMIITKDSSFNHDLFKVLHHVIRTYVDVLEKYSFSMAMYLPEYSIQKTKSFYKSDRSTVDYSMCRIVFRTPVSNLRSDVNGLDLYTSSVLGVDRYQIASKLFPILKLTLK